MLIIDDDADIRAVLCDILAGLNGYDVVEAATATEALSTLAREPRAWVALLDLDLPDACGEHVLRRVRAECGNRVVVIVCSAQLNAFERLRGYGADTIAKPFEIATITGAVQRAFRLLEGAGHRFDD